MLVNENGKSRILGILLECENCKTQLIDNSGDNLSIDYEADYSGAIVGANLLVSCPCCLEVNTFINWEEIKQIMK